MLFYSFFKTLIDKQIIVELKNDLIIKGTLNSVDQYLNIKLRDVSVDNPEEYPHLEFIDNLFIRGSVLRYVSIAPDLVNTELLMDATRRELHQEKISLNK